MWGAEINPKFALKNSSIIMAWIIIIVLLMIACVATAYLIPNERINTKNRKVNRPWGSIETVDIRRET